MWRLKDLLEHGGVKVLTPQNVLFARLLDLHYDWDYEEDEDDAAGDANDSPVGVVQVVKDVGFPFLCGRRTGSKTETESLNLKLAKED